MKRIWSAAAIAGILLGLSGIASSALGQNSCDAVLIPTREQTQKDYRIMEAYMSLNAESEYDRLQKLNKSELSVQASYGMYGGQFNQSQTAQEFNEKVRNSLDENKFSKNESDSRAYIRTGLDTVQVQAWQRCMEGNAGKLLLSARDVTNEGFTLVINRTLPTNVGTGMIVITLTGGSSGGQQSVRDTYTGAGSQSYPVHRNAGAETVTVQGNLLSLSDSVLVDYSPVPPPPVTQRPIKFKGQFIPFPGGYVTYDSNQKMTVSSTADGGPAENFSIQADLPRAGYYSVDAMWTAGVQTDVFVYLDAITAHCGSDMSDAAIHYLPQVKGGWGIATLPAIPQRVGYLLLPAGTSTIYFTSKACGGGLGGGRVPSTAWIELTEK